MLLLVLRESRSACRRSLEASLCTFMGRVLHMGHGMIHHHVLHEWQSDMQVVKELAVLFLAWQELRTDIWWRKKWKNQGSRADYVGFHKDRRHNCVTIYILFNYYVGNFHPGTLHININIYGINCLKRLYRWNSWSLSWHGWWVVTSLTLEFGHCFHSRGGWQAC